MFKEGDKIRIRVGCSGTQPGEEYIVGSGGANLVGAECSCPNLWELISNNNAMSNIKDFAKNLLLSKDEKLLREQGLKDSCGGYTSDAKELIVEKLTKENEAYLLEIATAKKAEEKE